MEGIFFNEGDKYLEQFAQGSGSCLMSGNSQGQAECCSEHLIQLKLSLPTEGGVWCH